MQSGIQGGRKMLIQIIGQRMKFIQIHWNYGLILEDEINKVFEIVEREWPKDNFPFTNESSPIYIKARAKKIKSWKIGDTKLVGELMDSPVESNEKEEIIELVPMGGSRLRISSFPVIKAILLKYFK